MLRIFGMKIRRDAFIGHYQIKHWQRRKGSAKVERKLRNE